MASTQLALPFGGEFSPGQVDLRWLLSKAAAGGTRSDLLEAIRARYFADSCLGYIGAARVAQQKKRAGNVLIGMRSYGLLEKNGSLTALGERLRAAETDADMYDGLARHILTHLNGHHVLDAVDVIQARGEDVTKGRLIAELELRGFREPQATTKHLVMLMWLRKAAVVSADGYVIDKSTVGRLLGADPEIVADLDRLTDLERYFLRALPRLSSESTEWLSASDGVNYAQQLYGVTYARDRWQDDLLRPLEVKGWIELERGSRGRGSRSGRVRPTPRLQSEFVQRLLEREGSRIPPELRPGLRLPLAQVLADLRVEDKNIKGHALELLALKLALYLDLFPRHLRLRSAQTGGAEVDLVVEGSRLLFTRWQIQCKNTASVHLDDLAKEIGLAVLLRAHVVVLVTTGKIGATVRAHARQVNEATVLQVVLLDGDILQKVAADAARSALVLVEVLNEQASQALQHKRSQLSSDDGA
jgi:hypothetical protein